MKVKKTICYAQIDRKGPEEDYSIYFIPSGFKGNWIKVWECYDYALDCKYASEEENMILNKKR